ncbi:MAG: hypothetical protein E6R03_15470 [Hyphomicrobiaceae bacterium]|nr:MAG: hypothetical protein E6R03_15470 [Hyphomicrobiaceae bacterium]
MSTQAHACTLIDHDGATIITPIGPLIVLGLPFAATPDRTIGHEMRHVTGWTHPPMLSILPGACREMGYAPPAQPDDPRTMLIHEYPITNATVKCNGKTACSEITEPGRCAIFVSAIDADEGEYGRAVRACFPSNSTN